MAQILGMKEQAENIQVQLHKQIQKVIEEAFFNLQEKYTNCNSFEKLFTSQQKGFLKKASYSINLKTKTLYQKYSVKTLWYFRQNQLKSKNYKLRIKIQQICASSENLLNIQKYDILNRRFANQFNLQSCGKNYKFCYLSEQFSRGFEIYQDQIAIKDLKKEITNMYKRLASKILPQYLKNYGYQSQLNKRQRLKFLGLRQIFEKNRNCRDKDASNVKLTTYRSFQFKQQKIITLLYQELDNNKSITNPERFFSQKPKVKQYQQLKKYISDNEDNLFKSQYIQMKEFKTQQILKINKQKLKQSTEVFPTIFCRGLEILEQEPKKNISQIIQLVWCKFEIKITVNPPEEKQPDEPEEKICKKQQKSLSQSEINPKHYNKNNQFSQIYNIYKSYITNKNKPQQRDLIKKQSKLKPLQRQQILEPIKKILKQEHDKINQSSSKFSYEEKERQIKQKIIDQISKNIRQDLIPIYKRIIQKNLKLSMHFNQQNKPQQFFFTVQDNQFINEYRFINYIRNQQFPYFAQYFFETTNQKAAKPKNFRSSVIKCDQQVRKVMYGEYYEKTFHQFTNRKDYIKLSRYQKIRQYFEIANCLRFFNERDMVYRDLKPTNIMIDKKNTIRMIDFGSCCRIYKQPKVNNDVNQIDKQQKLKKALKNNTNDEVSLQGFYQKQHFTYFTQGYSQKMSQFQLGTKQYQKWFLKNNLRFHKSQFLDVFSFGRMIQQLIQSLKKTLQQNQFLIFQLQYLRGKCLEVNPFDRLTISQVQVYLYCLLMIIKKRQQIQ